MIHRAQFSPVTPQNNSSVKMAFVTDSIIYLCQQQLLTMLMEQKQRQLGAQIYA